MDSPWRLNRFQQHHTLPYPTPFAVKKKTLGLHWTLFKLLRFAYVEFSSLIYFARFFSLSLSLLCPAFWLLLPGVKSIYTITHWATKRVKERDTVWARQLKKLNVIEFIYGFVCSLFTLAVSVAVSFAVRMCVLFFSLTAKNVDGFVNKYFIYFRPATANEPTRCLQPRERACFVFRPLCFN